MFRNLPVVTHDDERSRRRTGCSISVGVLSYPVRSSRVGGRSGTWPVAPATALHPPHGAPGEERAVGVIRPASGGWAPVGGVAGKTACPKKSRISSGRPGLIVPG